LKTQTITAIRRSEPLRIDWEDQGYSSSEFVTVTLNAANASRQYSATCRAQASAASLIISEDLLSKIPADFSGKNASIRVSLGGLRNVPSLFRAPMNDGREAAGIFSYSFIDMILVPVE
jgi:hypothetical protein